MVQVCRRRRPPDAGRPAAASNLLDFSGTEAASCTPECFVAVNTLNTHPILGSVALLNCHRPVFPLRFGQPGELDHWSRQRSGAIQSHRKKGLVVWSALPRLTDEHPQGEALAALVLGKIDAFEVGPLDDPDGEQMRSWYRLLDCGFRPVLVGGSGKNSNAVPLGAVRTYARLLPGEELAPSTWIEAVRAGRTFVTNGPLLSLSASASQEVAREPGSVVAVEPGQRISIRASAQAATISDRLEVVAGRGG